jgi:hypothetical protein
MTGKDIRFRPFLVGICGSLFALILVARVFSIIEPDPTVFIGFGEESTEINEYAEARLERQVAKRPALGHDGKYFFVQAHDPLVLEPDENIAIIDRPTYRSQRMLYPLVAGGLGLFGSTIITWSLLAVNVLALGAGTFATAVIAKRMGGSAWWGLAFAFNIGIVSEINIDGAGVLAAALAFGAVAAVLSDRGGWAVALLSMAALSREVMLLVAIGVAWWYWRLGRRRLAAISLVVPCTAVALWAIYLWSRLGWDSGVGEAGFAFELPFVGLVNAVPSWLESPLDMAAGLAVLVLLGAYLYRTLRSNALVGWAFVGFVPLTLVLSERVWIYYFDITRAVAPLITALVLMVFLTADSTIRSERLASGSPLVGG